MQRWIAFGVFAALSAGIYLLVEVSAGEPRFVSRAGAFRGTEPDKRLVMTGHDRRSLAVAIKHEKFGPMKAKERGNRALRGSPATADEVRDQMEASFAGDAPVAPLTPDENHVATAGDDRFAHLLPVDPSALGANVLSTAQARDTAPPLPAAAATTPVVPTRPTEPVETIAPQPWPKLTNLPVCATAGFSFYRPLTFTPIVEVRIERFDAGRYDVTFHYDRYTCIFAAEETRSGLSLLPDQLCQRELSTPQFCTLSQQRCSAPLQDLTCASELAQHHSGTASMMLEQGQITRRADGIAVDMRLSVHGCVLVDGLRTGPLDIHGLTLEIEPPPCVDWLQGQTSSVAARS